MRPAGETAGGAGGLRLPACIVGVAVGGFFDGILLHQILQWHHLLSAVPGEPFRDIRVQVMADGLFHALMYLVAAAGLWLLWRRRGALGREGSGRAVGAAALAGFGLWHVIDAVLFHWVLGIHHVRMETDRVLLWDLAFFVPGVLLLALGAWWGRSPGGGRPRPAAALLLAGLAAGTGTWALRAPGDGMTAVLFRPGVAPMQALAALVEAGALPVEGDPVAGLWIVRLPEGGGWRLYARGALFVGGAGLPAGCAAGLARALRPVAG
ncbi:MAG TPA: DUF2243 domain-containing protein [Azospirillaceae bacterium]|nr:DUF2243 domain-containing protein [Azospirillaceae bacterium]